MILAQSNELFDGVGDVVLVEPECDPVEASRIGISRCNERRMRELVVALSYESDRTRGESGDAYKPTLVRERLVLVGDFGQHGTVELDRLSDISTACRD